MQVFCLPSKSMCRIIQKPTTHSHPKVFSTIPLLTGLALAFTMVNLLLLWNLNFTYLCFTLGSPSDTRQACESSTSLQPYFSGLLLFLLFFNSFLFLTGFHQFLQCPPSFIIIYKHGSILHRSSQVPDPFPLTLEALCIMGSTPQDM